MDQSQLLAGLTGGLAGALLTLIVNGFRYFVFQPKLRITLAANKSPPAALLILQFKMATCESFECASKMRVGQRRTGSA